MPPKDIWKFIPVSYRTLVLWGHCPVFNPIMPLIAPSRVSGTADQTCTFSYPSGWLDLPSQTFRLWSVILFKGFSHWAYYLDIIYIFPMLYRDNFPNAKTSQNCFGIKMIFYPSSKVYTFICNSMISQWLLSSSCLSLHFLLFPLLLLSRISKMPHDLPSSGATRY